MSPTRSLTRAQGWALRSITWYQRIVEGRPSPCRFFPSGSSYAAEAFDVHGTRRGLLLTVRRLARCRPFGPSGFDPVPEPLSDRRLVESHHHTAGDDHTCSHPISEDC
jgi:putative membrane protein insertion efficiency factor